MADRKDTWQIASATKYKNEGRGQPRPSSIHHVGWDRAQQAFVLEDDHSLGSRRMNILPVRVEVAEEFLLRCMDPQFNSLFFQQYYPKERAEHVFGVKGSRLGVARGVAQPVGDVLLPGLTLSLIDRRPGPVPFLFLFSELAQSLGRKLRTLTEDEVRKNLRVG